MREPALDIRGVVATLGQGLPVLTPDERAALVVHCQDHRVVCARCGQALQVSEIGADVHRNAGTFCPRCRADLTPALRQHLAECTWGRVQAREARERAREARHHAHETSKESQQLRDRADVLAREAEAAQRSSRDVKRGLAWPGLAALKLVSAALERTPGVRYCAPCLAKLAGAMEPNDVRRIMELPDVYRHRLALERAECGVCHTTRRTLSIARTEP
jgi:hypothetical protein